ncbi:MAG: choice-of-anchor E domain-containing protein [Chitinophagaceae bacterium]
MKILYKPFMFLLLFFCFVILVSLQTSYAQCPDGSPSGGTAYDTTIAFEPGLTDIQVKFPQFDANNGMVTCVRLCITITGVVDTVALQNLSASAQTASFNYNRTDMISGPGIPSPLTGGVNRTYGPFGLTPYDGIAGAGTDFHSIARDTVLNDVLCATLNDSLAIAQFYGTDSVAYDYTINVSTAATFSGGNNSNFVLTSALVNFHFEYCTCPPVVLPVNIYDFNINKLTDNKIDLRWSGYDDIYSNYYYEAEVSRDGNNFSSIGSLPKNVVNNDPYKIMYSTDKGESGLYFFRIKQVYSNGYVRYSNIKQVRLENSELPKFSIYPNPSTGIVGIKFDNSLSGQFYALIYNTQGQVTVKKEIVAKPGSSYMELARLVPGVYWLRLTDKKSLESSVNQLLIK